MQHFASMLVVLHMVAYSDALSLNRMFNRINKPQELKYNNDVIIPTLSKERFRADVKQNDQLKAQISHSRFFNRIDDNQVPDFGEYFGLPILSEDPHAREWEYATNTGDTKNMLNMKF